ENKHDKTELKLAKLNEKLELLQAAIDAAELLPDGPAKDKLLAKLQKKLAALQGNIDAKTEKLDELDAAGDLVTDLILELDPDHFSGIDGLSAPEQLEVLTADEDGAPASLTGGDAGLVAGGASGAFGGGFTGGSNGSSFLLGPGDFPVDS